AEVLDGEHQLVLGRLQLALFPADREEQAHTTSDELLRDVRGLDGLATEATLVVDHDGVEGAVLGLGLADEAEERGTGLLTEVAAGDRVVGEGLADGPALLLNERDADVALVGDRLLALVNVALIAALAAVDRGPHQALLGGSVFSI